MAQYNGYRYVPHGSYNAWRAAVLGNGYNVDYSYGNQCWDLVALLYWQYGLTLITRPGGNGTAEDCWYRSRQANSKPPFISLTGKENIRRGDILVWSAGNMQNATGHIAFADMNYSQRNSRGQIQCLGQGQGSSVTNIVWIGTNIIGIFRNTKWDSTPSPDPTPTPTTIKRDNFPWPVAWKHWPNFKRK